MVGLKGFKIGNISIHAADRVYGNPEDTATVSPAKVDGPLIVMDYQMGQKTVWVHALKGEFFYGTTKYPCAVKVANVYEEIPECKGKTDHKNEEQVDWASIVQLEIAKYMQNQNPVTNEASCVNFTGFAGKNPTYYSTSRHVDNDTLAKVSIIMWRLWCCRNLLLWQVTVSSAHEIVRPLRGCVKCNLDASMLRDEKKITFGAVL
ncbi:hypothetical protein GH714_036613 [Hevea brasiliensis]|uniref:Uncharacterized protein n=1 Tax=Hevea brasiliensis TaxID=3981 RepID=A0A6A6KVP5_HEVBR|nr:hypothetical protein GH714_036613 [Hevea brasiliensis]